MTKISKVVVDKDICIGAASCVAIAPEVFDLDEDGKAYVKAGASLSDVEMVLDAARSCPVSAITVFDEDGTQLYPEVSDGVTT